MLKVIYQPEAEAELIEALPYYGSEGENDPFLATINHHVREIAADPQRFPKAGRNIRRCIVRKYPFIIFFKDQPDYWRRRI